MKTLRIGLVGAGHLGRIHARLLGELDGARLTAVAEPAAEARHAAAANSQAAEFSDYRDLIGRIDAAIIATPTGAHHAVAMELMRHGIHLLIEKPLCATAAEAEELVWAAHWHGVVLQVGHVERFNPALREALPSLRRPRLIEAVRQGGYTFRSTDIGVVKDLMIHDLDLLLWLGGSAVTSVAATGWSVVGGHEDVAQARIELADGCVANLFASRVSHRPCRQMQVWTDDGQIEIDFASRRVAVVEPAMHAETARASKFEDLLPMRQWEATAQNAILEEQREFLDCIRTGREPLASGVEGLRAIELAESVLASIADARWHGGAQRRTAIATAEPAPAPAPQTHPDILRGPHWPRRPISIPARRRKEAG